MTRAHQQDFGMAIHPPLILGVHENPTRKASWWAGRPFHSASSGNYAGQSDNIRERDFRIRQAESRVMLADVSGRVTSDVNPLSILAEQFLETVRRAIGTS